MSQIGSFRPAASGPAAVETLTGNSGGPVGPLLGNISIVGAGGVSVAGNPGISTLTITVSGSFQWAVISADQTAAVNHGYICNKAGTLALLLPATSSVGDVIKVTGMNTALGWSITQGAGQVIHFGTSTTTVGALGSLSSSNIYDSVELVCNAVNTSWIVLNSVGNITVV